MKGGCYTAIITPFQDGAVDYTGLDRLINFQLESGITGILAVGTTGESPTLTWEEHIKVIEAVATGTRDKCLCIAGTGSNNTDEALSGTHHAVEKGADAVLLVDPYYNGPSSLEIRREYVAPVASAFPEVTIIPYVIPGRTGAQLLPQDLSLLYREFKNVNVVKEATGDLENMKKVRECCGPDYNIFSGDDALTYTMMTDPAINAAGVISVISNVAPQAVVDMVRFLKEGNTGAAEELKKALDPLFNLVVVNSTENSAAGDVKCRARNPLPIKTLMNVLGMPSGGCRRPLGKMTQNGLNKVLEAARTVLKNNPEIFKPVEDFFGVNVAQRIEDPACRQGLTYDSY